MSFNIDFEPVQAVRKTLDKATATVISPKTFVALDASKQAIPAVAGSAAVAFCEVGAGVGEEAVIALADTRVVFRGTADAVFAETMKGTLCDLVGTGVNQLLDVGSSATDVFKIDVIKATGTVGSTANVKFSINKAI